MGNAIIERLIGNSGIDVGKVSVMMKNGRWAVDIPFIKVTVMQKDMTELIKEVMPKSIDWEDGGKEVHVWKLRSAKINYGTNQISFHVVPDYRLERHVPILPDLRHSGKVDLSGKVKIRLLNPGCSLPGLKLEVEVKPGEPNILEFPNWAEKDIKPGGKSLRDYIKKLMSRKEEITPLEKFSQDPTLNQVLVEGLTFSANGSHVDFDFNLKITH